MVIRFLISRELPVTQETEATSGKFFAEVHEDADKPTMLIQQVRSWLSSAGPGVSHHLSPTTGDALGNHIRNSRPVSAQDAATKNYVDNLSEGNNSYADNLLVERLEFLRK